MQYEPTGVTGCNTLMSMSVATVTRGYNMQPYITITSNVNDNSEASL